MTDTPAPPVVCLCGHDSSWHEHYREGTDCSICGPLRCPGLRPGRPPISPGLRRALAVILGVPALVTGCVLAALHLTPAAVVVVLVIGAAAGVYVVRRR